VSYGCSFIETLITALYIASWNQFLFTLPIARPSVLATCVWAAAILLAFNFLTEIFESKTL